MVGVRNMPRKWWVLSSVACGTFMATLDSSIINIALPTLTKSLGADLGRIKWVVVLYLFVITATLLPWGKVSDIKGRKFVFQGGYIIFTLGSALCGMVGNLPWMLVARLVQGIGAAMLMANGPAIITTAFPDRERGKALGTMAMVVSLGLVTGPVLGGYLVETLGWRSLFLVNVPIGFLGMWMAGKFIEETEPTTPIGPFDWGGFVVHFFFILAFMMMVEPPSVAVSGSGFYQVPHWILAVLSGVLLILFFRVERNATSPLFDLDLLKIPTFLSANFSSFIIFVSFSAISVMMPFFLEEVLSYSPKVAGLMLSSIPLVIFVVAPLSGRISDRVGSQGLCILGAILLSGVLFALAQKDLGLDQGSGPTKIIFYLGLVGLSMGIFQSPNNRAIMTSIPESKLGVASALLGTVRNLGFMTGTGLTITSFQWRRALTDDFVASLHWVWAMAACICLLAVAVHLIKLQNRTYG